VSTVPIEEGDLANKLKTQDSAGGMAKYYESLTELIEYRMTSDIKKVVVNTSAQPNSIPHFGTMTTLFCAFIFAKMVKERYKIDTEVEFDFIECGPCADYHKNGGDNYYSIAKTPSREDPNMSVSDYYISRYYLPLLHWSGDVSGINYSTRLYSDFQKDAAVRTALISICNDRSFFELLLNPKNKKLHIRPECPACGRVDKLLKNTEIEDVSPSGFKVSGYCGEHGSYCVDIGKSDQNYIGINTQLRDIAKGVLMNSYLNKGVLGVMLDGGDWGGTWTHRIHCESMQRLKCRLPVRLFAPLILDWSGGKLSKSIYQSGTPTACNPIENYDVFMERYGENGLRCIYREVTKWLSDPKKFFRSYSLEYILEILKRN